MLKKAGIVVAAATAGLLVLSPLAYATDGNGDGDGGGHNTDIDVSKSVDVEETNSGADADADSAADSASDSAADSGDAAATADRGDTTNEGTLNDVLSGNAVGVNVCDNNVAVAGGVVEDLLLALGLTQPATNTNTPADESEEKACTTSGDTQTADSATDAAAGSDSASDAASGATADTTPAEATEE